MSLRFWFARRRPFMYRHTPNASPLGHGPVPAVSTVLLYRGAQCTTCPWICCLLLSFPRAYRTGRIQNMNSKGEG